MSMECLYRYRIRYTICMKYINTPKAQVWQVFLKTSEKSCLRLHQQAEREAVLVLTIGHEKMIVSVPGMSREMADGMVDVRKAAATVDGQMPE